MTAPTAIAYQQIVRTGLEETLAAVDGTNGNSFQNDGRMILHVANGAVAPITVTIDTPNTVDGLAVAQLPVVVTNGEERYIGPFPPNIYNDSSGNVNVTYSSGATVTAAVLRL
jgi:hypothetical protein